VTQKGCHEEETENDVDWVKRIGRRVSIAFWTSNLWNLPGTDETEGG
jgi:hypothetical protein